VNFGKYVEEAGVLNIWSEGENRKGGRRTGGQVEEE
jgi:hypothetical protein